MKVIKWWRFSLSKKLILKNGPNKNIENILKYLRWSLENLTPLK